MNDQTNVCSAAQLVGRERSKRGAQELQASCRQAGQEDGGLRVGTWNPKVDLRVLMRQPRYVVNTAVSNIVQIRPAASKLRVGRVVGQKVKQVNSYIQKLQSRRIATVVCIIQ